MEYGAGKYCKDKAAAFQDRINHLSVEPLGRQLDCILGNGSFTLHGNGTRISTGNGSGTVGNNGVFPKWNRNSLNSANSGNLINHSSINRTQFKDPVSHMCLAGVVVTS